MSRYLLFKRKAKTSLRQFYSKNNGTVLFFKRYLDIRTFSFFACYNGYQGWIWMKLKKSSASFYTLSLPECLMEFCKVTLTFESAVQILRCEYSNESSLPVLTHGAICFSKFHKMKFRNLVENCFWLNLAVKGLMLRLQKLQKIIVLYLLHNSLGAFCVWVKGT